MIARTLFALALLVGALVAATARAVPGVMCERQSECSRGELCLADSPTSNVGHCALIRVLP
jgi:hypothetical protein